MYILGVQENSSNILKNEMCTDEVDEVVGNQVCKNKTTRKYAIREEIQMSTCYSLICIKMQVTPPMKWSYTHHV